MPEVVTTEAVERLIRIAFNKENPSDLLMQLVKVLGKAGLKDEASRVKSMSKDLQQAWSSRDKAAAMLRAALLPRNPMPTVSQRIAKLTEDVNTIREAALPSGTVEMFLEVLTSKLTQWDKRYNKNNPYALGHFLEAVKKVRDALSADLKKDDPASLEKLKKTIDRKFDPQFGPVKTTKKQIDQYLEKGTKPSLVRRGAITSTQVAHLKDADFLEELMKLQGPEPTPEEKRASAIEYAVKDGARRAWNSWSGHPGWRGWVSDHGGKWPSAKPAPGVKERASFQLINDHSWQSLKKHGVRSPRDLGDKPVEIWMESEYRPDYDFYDDKKVIGASRWTTGYGYTTGAGRKVYLRKGDMKSIRFAEEGLKKFLKTIM